MTGAVAGWLLEGRLLMTATDDPELSSVSGLRRLSAWAVHLFTACGAICCLLALEATLTSRWRDALGWLVMAVFI
ncbi:MAG: hypothetical protein MI861_01590, partial [Pirellulales bacterium]|nr:hypothetical protein [Pirellulales bacterium]